MRLRTENIHEYRLKCNTVAQITLDDDFNVPDTKDDIELIVKEWGNVQTDSVKVNKDKAAVDGELKFSLLYIGASSDSERVFLKMSIFRVTVQVIMLHVRHQ